MSVRYSHVLIDSYNRLSGTSHDYTIVIDPALFSVTGMKLKAVSILLSNYTINNANNQIYFSDGTTNFTATLVNGIYDSVSILTAINNAMNATLFVGTISSSFSDISEKITISSAVNFKLMFGIFTTNSANNILGFNSVDTSLGLDHTGDNAINLFIPPVIFIKILETSNMCRSTNGCNGSFSVYTNGISGDICFFFNNTHYDLICPHTMSSLNQLHITLVDPRTNTLFDINNNDWTMLLELMYD